MVRGVRPGLEQQGEEPGGPGRLSSTPQAQHKEEDKNRERPSPLYLFRDRVSCNLVGLTE